MVSRRKFSSAFKSRVALVALKERESLAELSVRFEVSQEMISRWKGKFLRLSEGIFDNQPPCVAYGRADLYLSYAEAACCAYGNKNRTSIVESSKKALQNTKKATRRIA